MGVEAYWLSSFLWDVVSLIPPMSFTLIIMAAADVKALIDGEAGAATCLLFLLFGVSMVCHRLQYVPHEPHGAACRSSRLLLLLLLSLVLPLDIVIHPSPPNSSTRCAPPTATSLTTHVLTTAGLCVVRDHVTHLKSFPLARKNVDVLVNPGKYSPIVSLLQINPPWL